MPWAVVDCPAFQALSHPAKALLFEFARQFVRDNNGRLLASRTYLSKRGWASSDVITAAKAELITAGFLHETVKGHRPHKASWYAVTWRTLDRIPATTWEPLKHSSVEPTEKRAPLRPSGGTEGLYCTASRYREEAHCTASRCNQAHFCPFCLYRLTETI